MSTKAKGILAKENQFLSNHLAMWLPLFRNEVDMAPTPKIGGTVSNDYKILIGKIDDSVLHDYNWVKELYEAELVPSSTISNSIDQGETQNWIANVLSGIKEVIFALSWPGSDLDIKAIDPNGIEYTGVQVEPTLEEIRVENPIEGHWQILITGTNIPAGSETFTLSLLTSLPTPPSASVIKRFKPEEIKSRRRGSVLARTSIINNGEVDIIELTYEDEILSGWTTRGFGHTVSVSMFADGVEYEMPYDELTFASIDDDEYFVRIDFDSGITISTHNGEETTIHAFEPGWVIEIKYPVHPPKGLEAGDYKSSVSVTVMSSEEISVTFMDSTALRVNL